MQIGVFVRYAPDPATVELVRESGQLDTERLQYKLGRADLVALEQAVRLAESSAGNVTVFCVAPPSAEALLKNLYAGGAAHVIRLWPDPKNAGDHTLPDEMAQPALLASAIKGGAFDLLVGGASASDGTADILGPALAAYLNWPQACNLARLELTNSSQLYAERKLERGEREALKITLPALVTMAEGSLEPRYPAMPAYLAALRRSITLQPTNQGQVTNSVRTLSLNPPRPRPKKLPRPLDQLPYYQRIEAILAVTGGEKKGTLFEGSPAELADRIVAFLVSNKFFPPQ